MAGAIFAMLIAIWPSVFYLPRQQGVICSPTGCCSPMTETAIRLASEPLLAAIRLQWWHDAVEKRRHENVPLMTRLLSHIEAGHITADDLTTQLALWQDRREQGSDGAAARWRDLFVILAGSGDVTEAAGMIGAALVKPDRTVAILDRHIDDLPSVMHGGSGCLACFSAIARPCLPAMLSRR